MKDNFSYKDDPIHILDSQVKKFMNNEVFSFTVLWKNHLVEGATWKAKADMNSHYCHLFDNIG